MTKQTSPLFHRLLNAIGVSVKQLGSKITHCLSHLKESTSPSDPWPPLEELALTPLEDETLNQKAPKNTQWVLAETTDVNNKNRQVVIVEVESFSDPHDTHIADLRRHRQPHLHNYTKDGEDPNLRITQYPSNLLH